MFKLLFWKNVSNFQGANKLPEDGGPLPPTQDIGQPERSAGLRRLAAAGDVTGNESPSFCLIFLNLQVMMSHQLDIKLFSDILSQIGPNLSHIKLVTQSQLARPPKSFEIFPNILSSFLTALPRL